MENVRDNNLFHRLQINVSTGKPILNLQLIPTFTDYRDNSLKPFIQDQVRSVFVSVVVLVSFFNFAR